MTRSRKRTARGPSSRKDEDSRVAESLAERFPALLIDSRRRIIAVSAAAVRVLGIRADACIGKFLDEVLPRCGASPDTNSAIAPGRGGSRGSKSLHGEVRRLGALDDPTHRQLELIDVPLPSGGRWLYLVDRTEQARARAECLHLGQLASAGRLISGIVHEINNPLSGIIGYVQLLLLRDHDRDTRSSLEKIQSEALRSSRIVRNLLDFSRRRSSHEGAVDIGVVAKKALELKAHDLRVHNVTVQVDIPRNVPKVVGDAHPLLQVFVNLIANAEQAMYESDRGGRISIRARPSKQDVTITLSDTGPGIPPQLRDRVFDPFFTTKPEGKGTGLGLGLCREILHHHGGSILLCENSESGATFAMRLPIAVETSAVERAAKKRRPIVVRGHRLLVVEDDPICRAFVTEAFESTGNEVHAFDRTEGALKFLQSRAVDAIISDLHRPGPNGLEFHGEVTKLDEQLAARILFLTGDTLNQELTRMLARAGNLVLAKPVELEDLHHAVGKLVNTPPRKTRPKNSQALGNS